MADEAELMQANAEHLRRLNQATREFEAMWTVFEEWSAQRREKAERLAGAVSLISGGELSAVQGGQLSEVADG